MFLTSRLPQSHYNCRCSPFNRHLIRSSWRYSLFYLVTIYVNLYKKRIIDQASAGSFNSILVFAYIGSIVFLLLGICGVYGSLKTGKDKKGNKCLLGMYTIGVIIFFFVFFAGIFVFFFAPRTLFSTDCKSGDLNSLNIELFNKSNEVYGKFCKAGC